jgi:hypothetical protein
VQKQARYDPKKLYRFTEAKRNAKLDVYQLVGSCDVSWGLDEAMTQTVKVIGSEGDAGMKLSVNVAPVMPNKQTAAGGKVDNEKKSGKGDTSARARKYLKEQDVEGLLTNAMRALLQAMPGDSKRFLSDYILSRGPQQETLPRGAVLPFKTYYLSNVMRAVGPLGWAKIHNAFPRKPRLQAMASSSAAGGASEESIRRLEAEVRELRESNRRLQDMLSAKDGGASSNAAGARSMPEAPVVGDFRNVSAHHMASIYAHFPRPVPRTNLAMAAAPVAAVAPSQKAKANVLDDVRLNIREALEAAVDNGDLEKATAQAVVRNAPVVGDFRNVPAHHITALHAKFPSKAPAGARGAGAGGAGAGGAGFKGDFRMAPSVGSWLQHIVVEPEEEEAAAKIQAIRRGQQARRNQAELKKAQALGSSDLESLRKKAFGILMEAGNDGSLAQALDAASARGSQPLRELQARAGQALQRGLQDGRLFAALQYGKGSTKELEKIRTRAGEALMKAELDGTLETSLQKAKDAKDVQDTVRGSHRPMALNTFFMYPSMNTCMPVNLRFI